MGIKNKYIYNADPMILATLREEYEMLGYHTTLPEPGVLIVHTRRPRKKKVKEEKRERRDS